MIGLMSVVTYCWPSETSDGGCSETFRLGSHPGDVKTAVVSSVAAVKKSLSDWMFDS